MSLETYFFCFKSTGNAAIDKILSAVDRAAKAYRNTESWMEDSSYVPDPHTGEAPVDWIQNAANEAAEAQRVVAADRYKKGVDESAEFFDGIVKGAQLKLGQLQERYECNTALLHARTRAMNEAHARIRELEAALVIVTYAKSAGPDFDWDAYYADILAAAEDALAPHPDCYACSPEAADDACKVRHSCGHPIGDGRLCTRPKDHVSEMHHSVDLPPAPAEPSSTESKP